MTCDIPSCPQNAAVVLRTRMRQRADGTWFRAPFPNRFDLCVGHDQALRPQFEAADDALAAREAQAIRPPPIQAPSQDLVNRRHAGTTQEMTVTTKACSEPGCIRPFKAKGRCGKHYDALRYGKGLTKDIPQPSMPTVVRESAPAVEPAAASAQPVAERVLDEAALTADTGTDTDTDIPLADLQRNLQARGRAARLATFTDPPRLPMGMIDDDVVEVVRGILQQGWSKRRLELHALALSERTTAADVERVISGGGL
jgi:hypothetical protein